MGRWMGICMLVGLLFQQGACCCASPGANGWIELAHGWLQSAGVISVADAGAETAVESHCHHCAGHEHHDHDAPAEDSSSHESHHFCVGSHLFYLTATGQAADHLLTAVATEFGSMLHTDAWHVTAAPAVGGRNWERPPATPTLPLRARLQVFLI